MPLISEASQTQKDKLIRQLRQLPDELLEEFYSLDIISLKGRMQYNSFLANRYRKYRELSPNEGWLRFGIGDWTIQMETED